jgi:hypothetical protein
MATEIETLRVLKILGDIYPSFHLSSSAIEVYMQVLADIPGPVLEQAALDHISRSTFFPAIAELRSAAFGILEAANPIPTDYEAWAELQAEIRRVGHSGKPHFKNPIAAQVVDQLGWRYLCLSENPVADRAHFVQAYQALAERQRHSVRRLQVVTEFIATLKANSQPQLTGGEGEQA